MKVYQYLLIAGTLYIWFNGGSSWCAIKFRVACMTCHVPASGPCHLPWLPSSDWESINMGCRQTMWTTLKHVFSVALHKRSQVLSISLFCRWAQTLLFGDVVASNFGSRIHWQEVNFDCRHLSCWWFRSVWLSIQCPQNVESQSSANNFNGRHLVRVLTIWMTYIPKGPTSGRRQLICFWMEAWLMYSKFQSTG